jgi:hypothetical protein
MSILVEQFGFPTIISKDKKMLVLLCFIKQEDSGSQGL